MQEQVENYPKRELFSTVLTKNNHNTNRPMLFSLPVFHFYRENQDLERFRIDISASALRNNWPLLTAIPDDTVKGYPTMQLGHSRNATAAEVIVADGQSLLCCIKIATHKDILSSKGQLCLTSNGNARDSVGNS